jgi:hypothetical protein
MMSSDSIPNIGMLGVKWSIGLMAVIFLCSCTKRFDPSALAPGMRTEAVISKVGEPKAILPLIEGYEIWRYQDDHVVLMEKGRVQNVGKMTPEQYEQTLEELEQATAGTESRDQRSEGSM